MVQTKACCGDSVPSLVSFFVLQPCATGKPLTKVVEQPVKAADIPDEQYQFDRQPRSVEMRRQIGNQTLD